MSCKAALKKEAKYTADASWTFVFFFNSIARAIELAWSAISIKLFRGKLLNTQFSCRTCYY